MTDTTSEAPHGLAVFEHLKRRDWGLGILAWEDKQKRGYLFENGQLRILAQEFYPLMREVDRPRDEVQALFDALRPELEAAGREAGVQVRSARRGPSVMTFDDQVVVFRAENPGGFEDAGWVESQRGAGAKKRLPRHRDPAIAQAATELGAQALHGLIAARQPGAVVERVVAVLGKTDLVPAAELKELKSPLPEHVSAMASAIIDLLHGESGYVARFDRFLTSTEKACGKRPGWQLATTLAALVHPHEHFSVRPGSFREQAKWMAPRFTLEKIPSGAGYMRCLTVAKLVSTKLIEQAESPRDLLDVYDFVRITTRPAAKQLFAKIQRDKHAKLRARTESNPE